MERNSSHGSNRDMNLAAGLGALRTRVRAVTADAMLVQSAALLAFTLLADGLGFVYHIMMGRMLGPQELGAFRAGLALMTLAARPLAALEAAAAHLVSRSISTTQLGGLLLRVRAAALVAGLAAFALTVALAPFIARQLDLSISILIVAGAMLAITPVSILYDGIMIGGGEFRRLGTLRLVLAVVRLIAAAGLVYAGLGATGAMLGMSVGLAAATLVAALIVPIPESAGERPSLRGFVSYSVPATLAILGYTAVANVDMIAVRYYFPAQDAGLYAGADIIANAAVIASTVVGTVLFPLVARKTRLNESGRADLLKALVTTGVVALGVVTLLAVAPTILLSGLLGEAFVDSAAFLPWLAAAMGLTALLNVVLRYLLASGKERIAAFVGLLAILQIGLMFLFHDTLMQIITAVAFTSAVGLVAGLLFTLRAPRPEPLDSAAP